MTINRSTIHKLTMVEPLTTKTLTFSIFMYCQVVTGSSISYDSFTLYKSEKDHGINWLSDCVLITFFQTMATWQSVHVSPSPSQPCPRWGHGMVAVDNALYLFGGYENSNYLNDLWRYSLDDLSFTQLFPTGDAPPPCSNLTMNYHPGTNQIIVFGGGAANKEKLNGVYALSLQQMQWRHLTKDYLLAQPWQRSYHCAQLIDDYLVMFGGEFFHDLGDTWVYDLNNNTWTEVEQHETQPCPRKFSASFSHNGRMYVVGGCHKRYQALSDAYYLEVDSVSPDQVSKLQWHKVQLTNVDLLRRWGHSLVVESDTVFCFGGRLSTHDLQNVVRLDMKTLTCNQVELDGPAPKGRRKSGVCLRNRLLFVHSGFNGDYVDDFLCFNLIERPEEEQEVQVSEDNKDVVSCVIVTEDLKRISEETSMEIKGGKFILEGVCEVTESALAAKSPYFASFFREHFKAETFQLSIAPDLDSSYRQQLILTLMNYIATDKVTVPSSCVTLSFFHSLACLAEYYCLQKLYKIAKQQLLLLVEQELANEKAPLSQVLKECEEVSQLGEQYSRYLGYMFVCKLAIGFRGRVKDYSSLVSLCSTELGESQWLGSVLKRYRFELQQMLLAESKQQVLGEVNVNSQGEQSVGVGEKQRKGSTHL